MKKEIAILMSGALGFVLLPACANTPSQSEEDIHPIEELEQAFGESGCRTTSIVSGSGQIIQYWNGTNSLSAHVANGNYDYPSCRHAFITDFRDLYNAPFYNANGAEVKTSSDSFWGGTLGTQEDCERAIVTHEAWAYSASYYQHFAPPSSHGHWNGSYCDIYPTTSFNLPNGILGQPITGVRVMAQASVDEIPGPYRGLTTTLTHY